MKPTGTHDFNKTGADARLRGLQYKSHWGVSSAPTTKEGSLLSYRDNEMIYISGKKVVHFDCAEQKSKTFPFQISDHHSIQLISLSPDQHFLAAATTFKVTSSTGSLKEKKSQLLVFDVENITSVLKKPMIIDYSFSRIDLETVIRCISFCDDASLLAVVSNVASAGIAVYNRSTGLLQHQINTTDLVWKVSFNPIDNTRLLVTGENNMFQFWRCTQKVIRLIPIGMSFSVQLINLTAENCLLTENKRKGNHVYTCHGTGNHAFFILIS